ncbi:hypothetical protein [Streptomyces inhibens]|uniref:hypothetical protein n=1 Tax=Streptomyces inhibens TaxID=2293571 RepID=UPI001EE7593A|nr:hypothetical protein [Streptomyces inhibens]UKY47868.1 hypothetical protein KI385_02855 [Streptomyces inhibens]
MESNYRPNSCRGLIFTGVSTYYGAKVAQDQLDQSRKTTDEESRAQASRVYMWSEPSKNYTYATNGVFANRSLDPVTILDLAFTTFGIDNKTGKSYDELHDVIVIHPIQPCSSFTITPPDIIRGDGERYSAENTYVDLLLIYFRDTNGKQWVRAGDGKLSPVEGNFGIADFKKMLGHRLDAFKQVNDVKQPDVMNPKGKPLEDCAAGS